jgi:mono/diheme cytochrome c family protein
MRRILVIGLGLLVAAAYAMAQERPDPAAAARGKAALEGPSFLAPAWSLDVYEKAREQWNDPKAPDPKADPEGYAAAFRSRYGLHPAPYPNDGLPMGLKKAVGDDGRVGISLDCTVCHGGSIGGTSLVGLGNTQLDLKGLLDELTRADGKKPPVSLFTLNSARGTNNAGQIAVVLLHLRNADLSMRKFPLFTGANVPELDTPPWWMLGRKRSKYYDGRTDARAIRSNMQFLLGGIPDGEKIKALEGTFRDLDAYLKSLTPPKYPFPIDTAKADAGKAIFEANCARCHGTYGPGGSYPNKIIPIDAIGTDRKRLDGLTDKFIDHYNSTWLGQDYPVEEPPTGYQAPPLDGVWATAPYLHNGSVPTLWLLLKSSERPARFTRPPSTDFAHYDRDRVGWRFDAVDRPLPPDTPPHEARKVFDSSRFGLGNGGHTFGDKLSDAERSALIEYLKTL